MKDKKTKTTPQTTFPKSKVDALSNHTVTPTNLLNNDHEETISIQKFPARLSNTSTTMREAKQTGYSPVGGQSRAMLMLVVLVASSSAISHVAGQEPFEISDRVASGLRDTEDAEYSCTFTNLWSAARHPNLYPNDGSAHWTSPVLASHNMNYTMWEAGGLASPGVEDVAEVSYSSISHSIIHWIR